MATAVVIMRIAVQRIEWVRSAAVAVLTAGRVVRTVAGQLCGAVLTARRTVRFGGACGRSVGVLSQRLTMNALNASDGSLHHAWSVVHRVADRVRRQSGVDVRRMAVECMMVVW